MSARPNTTVEHVETENAVVVTVRGEIDAANAPELADGITSGTALAVAVGRGCSWWT
ncbi:hypothetical protein ACFQV2_31295 [Actinokineospora soli]|uniref:Anti-anti-sigma factor n=1 Tax=Actinokineospora soli TaxID=1048753 RepID=A0ABW2TWR3_9PSEU